MRGMASVLRDTTNQQVREGTRGRESKLMAQERLKSSSATMRPRGDSALGANTRWTSSMQKGESEDSDTDRPVSTLKQVIQHCPEQFERGASYIDDFVEQGVSPEILKALALKVFNLAIAGWGDGIVEAAAKAGQVVGVNGKTVQRWAAYYYISLLDIDPSEVDDEMIEMILASGRGKNPKNPYSLIKNDEFCMSARDYVKKNSCIKGEPNLTAEMFRMWVKSEYNCDISGETARRWLHSLGFRQVNHQKGIYFDGHEREDVVEYRKSFVEKLEELDNRRCKYEDHTPVLQPGEKPLIIVHHDESTYFANADQSHYWADDSTTILKQKSLGQAIMVSDFIEEASTDFLHYGKSKRDYSLKHNLRVTSIVLSFCIR